MPVAEEVESIAYASAIFWACRDGTWCKLEKSSWRCLSPGTEFCLSPTPSREKGWLPWTTLLDRSDHPYVSWFVGAKTNISFTAVDVPALASCTGHGGGASAYEAVVVGDDLDRNHPSNSITRSELLLAALTFSARLEGLVNAPLTSVRAYVHAATGLEQAVACHSFARVAVCYTCTALDATDESLKHRCAEFRPALVVASSDVRSGSMHEFATVRCLRLLKRVPCFEVTRGDCQAWASQLPSYVPPVPVGDANALMVVFTSGSTGRPKGLVHGHGGYGSCVARSMSYVFNARPGVDVVLTLATFSWITGQSYMLYGPALAQCTSLLLEGSPLGADGLWWARVAKARGATILKCAASFARHAMGDHARHEAIRKMDLPTTLRIGTFCAEPVSTDVQQWASKHLVTPFLNSYWATEHGSIIMSRNPCGKYEPDARCWPVPWVKASVVMATDDTLGDFVLLAPYAGLARTIFGGLKNYAAPNWRGSLPHFKTTYFPENFANTYIFLQGDAARASDRGFTFHGRRDEVLNVLGIRVGIEELEKVAWSCSSGLVTDLAIVGAPDTLKGQVPIGWVVLSDDVSANTGGLLCRWRSALSTIVGSHAEPGMLLSVITFPKTITGKTQRGLLQAALWGEEPLHPSVAARAVCHIGAYVNCYLAAQRWRLHEATSLAVPLREIAFYWKNMCFDCHDIGGSPLLPATGWLYIMLQALSQAPVSLHKIQFLRGVRDMHESLILRRRANDTTSVEASDGRTLLNCEYHVPCLTPLTNIDSKAWSGAAEILDDMDDKKHYQRCRSVTLRYDGPFKCVKRVVWRSDWVFRAFASASNATVLLDAALQVICSVDALGRGATFIPFYIRRFEAAIDIRTLCPEHCLIVGSLNIREDLRLECDMAFYAAPDSSTATLLGMSDPRALIATMEGVKFTKLNGAHRVQSACNVLNSVAGAAPSSMSLSENVPTREDDASLLHNVINLGSKIVGSEIDPSKTLFENGLHSLRAIEFIGKLNQAYSVNLSAVQLVTGEETFTAISSILSSAIDARSILTSSLSLYTQVDHKALQRIVDARLTGVEASSGLKSERQRSALAEAARGIIYMVRRGFQKYLQIQYNDGLFRFLFNTPTTINLYRTVVVPGIRVQFQQTDYNRHFTVREIIRDSERGFYNLIHASGLAHLEHYYRIMFFASRLEARFDAELLEGELYEMRCKVTNINGPLVDAEVAFFSLRRLEVQAFVVTWRLMLVINPQHRLMYDFELGGAFGSTGTTHSRHQIPCAESTPSRELKRSDTWTLTRQGNFITSGSIAFCGVLIGLYAMAPVAIRIFIPLPLVVADVLKNLKAREAIIIFAILGLWLRTHPGQKPLEGPVDMLLPHG
mmetsp:Transcript_29081/g.86877  ORF Transcript_29081/g.86877 Transcript_29081/m.86877 type:complete len:1361 (-) Transcript_29081:3452-7534(-)